SNIYHMHIPKGGEKIPFEHVDSPFPSRDVPAVHTSTARVEDGYRLGVSGSEGRENVISPYGGALKEVHRRDGALERKEEDSLERAEEGESRCNPMQLVGMGGYHPAFEQVEMYGTEDWKQKRATMAPSGYPPVGRAALEKLKLPFRGMRGAAQGSREAPIDEAQIPN
ncbi:hypothetical protein PMAYCL1PPCAC_08104, partial [Pristionchus mayeri]